MFSLEKFSFFCCFRSKFVNKVKGKITLSLMQSNPCQGSLAVKSTRGQPCISKIYFKVQFVLASVNVLQRRNVKNHIKV